MRTVFLGMLATVGIGFCSATTSSAVPAGLITHFGSSTVQEAGARRVCMSYKNVYVRSGRWGHWEKQCDRTVLTYPPGRRK
jgi:hypothetical protein